MAIYANQIQRGRRLRGGRPAAGAMAAARSRRRDAVAGRGPDGRRGLAVSGRRCLPSLLATLAVDYYFTAPVYTFKLQLVHLPRLAMFALLAAFFATVSAGATEG